MTLSGFHTPKAVTYHEPTVIWLFVIGHSLGRMETCFGPSTLGAGIQYQNTSQIQILATYIVCSKKRGAMLECWRGLAGLDGRIHNQVRYFEKKKAC